MKILFSTLGYKPAWRLGGPVISVASTAEALVRRGHEVTVFATDSNLDQTLDVPTDRFLDVDGVKVRYFKRIQLASRLVPWAHYFSKSVGYLYSPEMRRALDALVPSVDLIHTHMPFVYPTYAAAHAAFRFRKPLFYSQRGVLNPASLKFRSLKKAPYLRVAEMPILRRAETLIALTEAEKASYECLGLHDRIRIIPNGIDADRYSHPPNPADIEPLGVRPEHKVVLFMARLHPSKGADRLLEAFLALTGEFPNAILVLAGPDEFGLERMFLGRAMSAGLRGKVIFPGMVTGSLKLSLLARADLFCLPSNGEGFSMAVLEALASSTAVLLTPGCNFPESERAGAGRVVRNDVASLTEGLRDLLSTPHELRQMGCRGVRLVNENYTWNRIADSLLEAYADGVARYRSNLTAISAR